MILLYVLSYVFSYLLIGYLVTGFYHRFLFKIKCNEDFWAMVLIYPLTFPIFTLMEFCENNRNIRKKLLKPFEKESAEALEAKISKLKEQE